MMLNDLCKRQVMGLWQGDVGAPYCDLGVSVSEGLEPAAVSEADFDPGIAC